MRIGKRTFGCLECGGEVYFVEAEDDILRPSVQWKMRKTNEC